MASSYSYSCFYSILIMVVQCFLFIDGPQAAIDRQANENENEDEDEERERTANVNVNELRRVCCILFCIVRCIMRSIVRSTKPH